MQEILLTNQSFRKIREANGLYIDKTKQMYNLFARDTYFFLARPRRFGKSLLCSTLGELFAGNRQLFKGLWIDNSDWTWKQYPVIHLDMTSAISSTGDSQEVRKKLLLMITLLAKQHAIDISLAIDPASALNLLIKGIFDSHGNQVVVIIDEYDKPLLDAIDKTDKFPGIHDELRAFYSPLKLLDDQLKYVFITGVFKFAKTSIFSGFNNLNDITFDIPAADICGYTEQEIRLFFAEHLEALATVHKLSVEEMMDSLRKKYNGYKFGLNIATAELSAGVYNAFALNYVFAKQQQLDKWFESGSPQAMMKQLARDGFSGFDPKSLNVEFNTLNTSCSPDGMTSLCTLYYAGYVTMRECYVDNSGKKPITMVKLDFPSEEVSDAYAKHLLPELLNKNFDQINQFALQLKDAFREQKLETLHELLNDLLSTTTYEIYTRSHDRAPKENLYQIAFHCLFIVANFRSVMEDSTNQGRIDITVELPEIVYLFELKMDKPAAGAIQQIKTTDYPRKFKAMGKKVYGIGVSISTQDRKVADVQWEAL